MIIPLYKPIYKFYLLSAAVYVYVLLFYVHLGL
jgi:hypothetical protein